MDQLMMLNLMQTPGERTTSAGNKNSGSEGFQKLMEQSQGGSTPAGESGKPADAQPAESAEAPKAQDTEPVPTVQDPKELERQMVLAAMAVMQNNPELATLAQETPEVLSDPAWEKGMVPVGVDDSNGLRIVHWVASGGTAEEPDPEGDETALELLEQLTETPEAQEAEPAEAAVETVKAPEAAEVSAEPKELEAEVQSGEEESRPETEEKVEIQEGAAERPVFQDVHEIPVKVGEAPAAEETVEQPVEVQVKDQLAEAISKGETKVEIQLMPESLGKIRVEMTLREDGGLLVQLHAENSRTQGILEKNMSGLEALLSRDARQEVQVEVPRHQESQQQNLFDQQQKQQHQQQQQQRREQPHSSEDFLQQLRLGLIPVDDML